MMSVSLLLSTLSMAIVMVLSSLLSGVFRNLSSIPAGNYMFKVNNRNTRTRCKLCSKLIMKIRRRSGVFIVNFKHISHLVVVLLLLTLSRLLLAGFYITESFCKNSSKLNTANYSTIL